MSASEETTNRVDVGTEDAATPLTDTQRKSSRVIGAALLAGVAILLFFVFRESDEAKAKRLETELAVANLSLLACRQPGPFQDCTAQQQRLDLAEREMNKFRGGK